MDNDWCGCTLHEDGHLFFCPLHAAAPAMLTLLEALEACQKLIDRAVKTGNGVYLDEAWDKARAAIKQAKGGDNG